jgi:hypothetical protein
MVARIGRIPIVKGSVQRRIKDTASPKALYIFFLAIPLSILLIFAGLPLTRVMGPVEFMKIDSAHRPLKLGFVGIMGLHGASGCPAGGRLEGHVFNAQAAVEASILGVVFWKILYSFTYGP